MENCEEDTVREKDLVKGEKREEREKKRKRQQPFTRGKHLKWSFEEIEGSKN